MAAGDLQTILKTNPLIDVSNVAGPVLSSANNTVNTAVQKTIDDFTVAQQQGTVSSFLNQGYQQLITGMGFDLNTVASLNQNNSNPVINAGVAGASEVFMNIVTKKLDNSNFGPLKSLNTLQSLVQNPIPTIYANLPPSLVKMHWFVVAMETLLRKNNQPNVSTFGKTNPAVLIDTTSYAQNLVNQFAPKQKFLFLMQIKFKGTFSTIFPKTFTFLIKKADRPRIKIEHEEINMYNFRTRFAKFVVHDPISLEFYDAIDKSTLNFFLTYMKVISPTIRSAFTSGSTALSEIESSGMNFDSGYLTNPNEAPTGSHQWSGSMNTAALTGATDVLPDEQTSIIEEIAIFHIYQFGLFADVYHYMNPRITDFGLDDLDMANGTVGNSMTLSFMYDAFNMGLGKYTTEILADLNDAVPSIVKRMDFLGASSLQTGTATSPTNTNTITATSKSALANQTPTPATPSRSDQMRASYNDSKSKGLDNFEAARIATTAHPRGPTDPENILDRFANNNTNVDFPGAFNPNANQTPPASASAIPVGSSSSFVNGIFGG